MSDKWSELGASLHDQAEVCPWSLALSCVVHLCSLWPWHFEPYHFNSKSTFFPIEYIRHWVSIASQDLWVSGMHPGSPAILLPLAACCPPNVHITPFSLMLPFCLLWWRYCTLLSCMLSRPQCNLVCVIFSRECMHTGIALACWDYSFFVLEGGTPGDELNVRIYIV